MGKINDFFELLGVVPEASDEEVKAAWHRHITEAGGPKKVKADILVAYQYLADAGNRQTYRKLLAACDGRYPITLKPELSENFLRSCAIARIQCFEHPKFKGEYHVRRLDQETPDFAEHPNPSSATRLTRWERFTHAVAAVFGGVFINKTLGERIGLAVLYIVVTSGLFFGSWQLTNFIQDQSQRATDRAHAKAVATIKATLLSKQATAQSRLISLSRSEHQLRERFRERIGISFETTTLPHELDACILKHNLSETWTSIHKAIPAAADISAERTSLGAISNRVAAETYLPEDSGRLDEIINRLDSYLAVLQLQWANIDRVREFLDIDRATKSSSTSEGSSR
jgi:hypothetical protein